MLSGLPCLAELCQGPAGSAGLMSVAPSSMGTSACTRAPRCGRPCGRPVPGDRHWWSRRCGNVPFRFASAPPMQASKGLRVCALRAFLQALGCGPPWAAQSRGSWWSRRCEMMPGAPQRWWSAAGRPPLGDRTCRPRSGGCGSAGTPPPSCVFPRCSAPCDVWQQTRHWAHKALFPLETCSILESRSGTT